MTSKQQRDNKRYQKLKLNKEWMKDRNIYKRKYQEEIRKWFEVYTREICCVDCYKSHRAILDFHHKYQNKDNKYISDLLYSSTKDKILKEINKCEVLCANCHRIRHWNECINLNRF